jgi:hypothetical protein
MKRFDFERYEKKRSYRYYIFDRQYGLSAKLAVAYDIADAEIICDALNVAFAEKEPA